MTITLTLRGVEHSEANGIRILRPTNLWNAPDLRVNDTDIPGSHGGAAGVDLYGMRRVPVVARLSRPTAAEAMQAMPEIVAAWAPGAVDEELTWTDPTGEYVLFGRPRSAQPDMSNAGSGVIGFDCRFAATDPFIYSAAEHFTGAGAPTPAEGLVFPLVFPLVFGLPGSGGTMQIHNAGTAPSSRWVAAVGGPCSEPRLSVGGRGVTYGGDLAAGQALVLDGRNRLALLQGTSTVHVALTERNWFALDPGDTEVQFSTADNQGGVFFSHRDAWW